MYLTPVMQMTWGVLVGHEPMPPARWLGFALIWVALAVFTADALRAPARVRPAPVRAVPAVRICAGGGPGNPVCCPDDGAI